MTDWAEVRPSCSRPGGRRPRIPQGQSSCTGRRSWGRRSWKKKRRRRWRTGWVRTWRERGGGWTRRSCFCCRSRCCCCHLFRWCWASRRCCCPRFWRRRCRRRRSPTTPRRRPDNCGLRRNKMSISVVFCFMSLFRSFLSLSRVLYYMYSTIVFPPRHCYSRLLSCS